MIFAEFFRESVVQPGTLVPVRDASGFTEVGGNPGPRCAETAAGIAVSRRFDAYRLLQGTGPLTARPVTLITTIPRAQAEEGAQA